MDHLLQYHAVSMQTHSTLQSF